MSEDSHSDYRSHLSPPPLSRSHFIPEEAASQLIELILDRVMNRLAKNAKFRENLKKFSNMKTIKNINEINSLNLYQSKMNFHSVQVAIEPKPLYVDSLLPISADIDKENTYKLRLKDMIQSQISQISKSKKPSLSKGQKKSEYLKLDIPTSLEQEDGFTKELRKMQQDRENKQKNEKKVKQLLQQEEKEKAKQKKKERQEKLSFDYGGSVIKIRSEGRNNLISKLINGNMNSKTQVNKQAINDPNPQTVDSVVLSKKKNGINSLIKRRDEVQFQDNRTLADGISVGAGVRYTYDGKTFELKKKSISTLQLKRTINQRRLNKEQFQRIRSLNGSSLELLNSEVDFRQTKHKKSQSDAKLLKKEKKKVEMEKIIVNNNNLREKMLQKVNQLMESERQEISNPQKKFEYVGQTDIFNMNYLKNGRDIKSQNNLQNLSTQRSLLLLPKVGKREKGGKDKQIFPKQRERIKEINTIIYEIRKKFDEKLKI